MKELTLSPFRHTLKRVVLLPILLLINSLFYDTVAQQQITREVVRPVRSAVVNMQQLSDLEALMPRPVFNRPGRVPNEGTEYEEPYAPFSPGPPETVNANRIAVASPAAVLNYEGIGDAAKVDGSSAGFWNIPPDTYGAVGLDKVFSQMNNHYRVQNKTTGAQLSLVSIETFWSALGTDGNDVFDPRVVYDPYNNRWIVAAVSHGGDAASRVLVGISQTHDPQGNYNLFSFDPDPTTSFWADYPMLGFNKNWVAIGINMFPVTTGSPPNRFYVINYPSLLTGTATATVFTGTSFCTHPVETYSSTEETLYAPNHISSAGATYALNSITGTPSTPVFNVGGTQVRTGGGWVQPGGNLAPQTCVNGAAPVFTCPGTLMSLEVGDAFIRGNAVFRNNAIWYAQTVGLSTPAPLERTAIQWTRLNTNGTFADGGRIDNPTATSTNGEQWYIYPTLAVNSSNDVLVGFSKAESDGYPGGVYTFRYGTDPAGTMMDPVVYRDGLDYYEKDFGSGRNRWGDYSHTMVDPLNDASFWTIQEYAQLRANPNIDGYSKWGTWWAKVDPNPCLSNVASGNWNTAATWGCGAVPTASNHVNIMSGQNVTLDVDPLAASITVNSGGTLTISSNRTLSCKLIVYGTLNITGGKLTLGTNDVFLAQNATLTGASTTSYFVTNSTGKVTKIIAAGASFEFPVSTNTSSYNGLIISNTSGPIEVFSARVTAGVTPSSSLNSACVQRTWNITEMTTGGNTATLTFKWAAAEHGSGFSAASAPYAFRHNGSTYVLASNMSLPSLSGGIYSSNTTSPISTFSPWIVSASGTLPVIMEYFTGTRTASGHHRLDWKATATGPRASFEVQRSGDGQQFSNLNRINADYDRCLLPFDYNDIVPLNGKNFYRIKMTDENGKVTYSKTILLLNSKNGFEIVNLQPNPASSYAVLNYSVTAKQDMSLVITDSKGGKVMQKTVSASTGHNQEELNLSTLSSGTYTLVLITATGEQKVLRFIKQ